VIVCVLVAGWLLCPASFGDESPVLWSLRHLACYGGGALLGASLAGESPKALGFRFPPRAGWWLVALGCAIGIFIGMITGYLGGARGYRAHGTLWGDAPMTALVSFGIAHASQEAFFRGYVLLDDSRLGPSLSIRSAAIQSLLGIAVHWDKGWLEVLGAAPVAVALSFLRLRTGSLLAPFLAHILAAVSANLVVAGGWKPL
jgi:membrane protease YdiL (CAAX protease family)